jgi:hypothetical protein
MLKCIPLTIHLREKRKMNLNTATSATDDDIKDIMDYHSWTPEQVMNGTRIRASIGTALKIIIETVPRVLIGQQLSVNFVMLEWIATQQLLIAGNTDRYAS